METAIVDWVYIRTMENKMETTIVYWGYTRILENNMETTIMGLKHTLSPETLKHVKASESHGLVVRGGG